MKPVKRKVVMKTQMREDQNGAKTKTQKDSGASVRNLTIQGKGSSRSSRALTYFGGRPLTSCLFHKLYCMGQEKIVIFCFRGVICYEK